MWWNVRVSVLEATAWSLEMASCISNPLFSRSWRIIHLREKCTYRKWSNNIILQLKDFSLKQIIRLEWKFTNVRILLCKRNMAFFISWFILYEECVDAVAVRSGSTRFGKRYTPKAWMKVKKSWTFKNSNLSRRTRHYNFQTWMVKINHRNHNIPNISAVFRILRLTFVGKSASKSCFPE